MRKARLATAALTAVVAACGGEGDADKSKVKRTVPPPEVLITAPDWLPAEGDVALRVAAFRGGRPSAGEPLRVDLNAGQTVFSGRTGAAGAADVRFRVPRAVRDSAQVTVVAGPPGAEYSVTHGLPVRPAARPLVDLDRSVVRAGESVRVRLTALQPDELRPAAGVEAALAVHVPSGEVVHRARGRTDLGGRLATELSLDPMAPSGSWRIVADAGATTETSLSVLPAETGAAPRPPLPEAKAEPSDVPRLEAIAVPEGGILVPGVDNRLLVLVSLDGRPAEATVELRKVKGVEASANSDPAGLARLSFVPPAGDGPLTGEIACSDEAGHTGVLEVRLPRAAAGRGLLVRPSFSLAPPGKPIPVEVTGREQGTLWLDVVRDGRTVLGRSVSLTRGRAVVDLDPGQLGTGLVWVTGRTMGDKPAWGGAPVFVPPPGVVKVGLSSGSEQKAAGDEVELSVRLTDELGSPQAGSVFGRITEGPSAGADAARQALARLLLGPAPAGLRHACGSLVELTGDGLAGLVPVEQQWVARALLATLTPPAPARAWKESTTPLPDLDLPDPAALPASAEEAAEPEPAGSVLAFPDAVRVEKGSPRSIEVRTTATTGKVGVTLVALSEGRLGVGSAAFPVLRPFDIEVPAPPLLSFGDDFGVPVRVVNQTEEPLAVNVRIEMAPWHVIRDVQEIRLRPAPGETADGTFRIRTKATGSFDVRIVARAGTVRRVVSVPVRVIPVGRTEAVERSGVLGEREQVVKFSVPRPSKGSPVEAELWLDTGLKPIAARAAEALRARTRRDLPSVAWAARATARVVAAGALEGEAAKEALAALEGDLQRLLSFRTGKEGWTLFRGGKEDERAKVLATGTLFWLGKAGVEAAKGAGAAPPPPAGPRPSIGSLLESRAADGTWGRTEDTEGAVAQLLAGKDLEVRPGDVFLELDGKPLPKARVSPKTGSVRVDLAPHLTRGGHTLRVMTPEPGANLPWALSVRTSVSRKGKALEAPGWKLKLKAGKAKKGKPAKVVLAAKRGADAAEGPLVVHLPMPPGGRPQVSTLEDERYRGNLDGFLAVPGALFLYVDPETKAGVTFGYLPTLKGSLRPPPARAWPLLHPE